MNWLIIVWLLATLIVSTAVCLLSRKNPEYIIATYAAAIVIANITAVKLLDISGVLVPASFVIYSATFLLTDVINERWGHAVAMKAVWAGFIALLLHVIVTQLAIHLDPSPLWNGQDAFEAVLGSSLRLSIASFAAFLVSQTLDVHLFARLRQLTSGRHLWLRNNVSTCVSQALDAVIFITIAFSGLFPVVPLIVGTIVLKAVVALVDTPFAYFVHWFDRRSRDPS